MAESGRRHVIPGRSLRCAAVALALAVAVLAPSAVLPEDAADFSTLAERTFKIEHKNVDDVYLLVSGLLSEEGVVTVVPKKSLISVKDKPERVEQVIRMIAQFDRPPDRVSLDVRLVKAFREPKPAGASPAPASDFPAGLPKVVNYQRFEMLQEFNLEGLEGRRISAGEEAGAGYRLDIHVGHVDKKRGIIVLEKVLLRQKVGGDKGQVSEGVRMEFSDILMNNRPRVFGSARTTKSSKALFVIIQGRVL
jgi:hypothetical protein